MRRLLGPYEGFFLFIRDWQRRRTDPFSAPDSAASLGLSFLALINFGSCYGLVIELTGTQLRLSQVKWVAPILILSLYSAHYFLLERRSNQLERTTTSEGRFVILYAVSTIGLFCVVLAFRSLG